MDVERRALLLAEHRHGSGLLGTHVPSDDDDDLDALDDLEDDDGDERATARAAAASRRASDGEAGGGGGFSFLMMTDDDVHVNVAMLLEGLAAVAAARYGRDADAADAAEGGRDGDTDRGAGALGFYAGQGEIDRAEEGAGDV